MGAAIVHVRAGRQPEREQKFDVPLSAGDRRDGVGADLEAERARGGAHLGQRARPRRLVAHDPPFSDVGPPHLELRLDRARSPAPPAWPTAAAPAAPAQRDERHVDDDRSTRAGSRSGGAVRMSSVDHPHPRIRRHLPVELPVPHVDAVDARRPALQQAVGETARRRPDVERGEPARIDAERVERVRQLEPAARHERHRPRAQPQLGVRVDQLARLVDRAIARQHLARQDERPRLLARGASPRSTSARSARRRLGAGLRAPGGLMSPPRHGRMIAPRRARDVRETPSLRGHRTHVLRNEKNSAVVCISLSWCLRVRQLAQLRHGRRGLRLLAGLWSLPRLLRQLVRRRRLREPLSDQRGDDPSVKAAADACDSCIGDKSCSRPRSTAPAAAARIVP